MNTRDNRVTEPLSQMLAERLSIPFALIRLVQRDSDQRIDAGTQSISMPAGPEKDWQAIAAARAA